MVKPRRFRKLLAQTTVSDVVRGAFRASSGRAAAKSAPATNHGRTAGVAAVTLARV